MLGVDIVAISRVEKIAQKFGKKGLEKFFAKSEIKQSLKKNGELNIQRIAGFWAAKEAFVKAIGTGFDGSLKFSDVRVKKDAKNAPFLDIKKEILKNLGVKKTALSISHDGGFAIAAVIIKRTKDSKIYTESKRKKTYKNHADSKNKKESI